MAKNVLFSIFNKEMKGISLIGKHFIRVYGSYYAWLTHFIEENGFRRIKPYRFGVFTLTDDFVNEKYNLSLTLDINFSLHRRENDVLSLWLKRDDIPSMQKRWRYVWKFDDTIKKELKLAMDAFSIVKVSFAEYDNKEPIYLHFGSQPLLRKETYYIADDEEWIHANTLYDLCIEAFCLGCTEMIDVRPLKYSSGIWDGRDENGHRTGGIRWSDGYGAIVKVKESQKLTMLKTKGERTN